MKMRINQLTYRIVITALLHQFTIGHDLHIELSGEMEVVLNTDSTTTKLDMLQREVLSKISRNMNIPEICLQLDVGFRNTSELSANYTVTIKQSKCAITADFLSITEMANIGATSIIIYTDTRMQSEFWRDKMNSILIFCGCGAIVLIVLVTCIVLTTGCYKTEAKKKARRMYDPAKPHFYHPYAVDTMTLDHRKYSRRENYQSVNGGKGNDTTIERWVNSQLSKSRQSQSSVADLNQERHRTASLKKDNSHRDISTTDSGIVTSSRRHNTKSGYVVETHQPRELSTQNRPTRNGSIEQRFYHEPHYETCESINYIHHNDGYVHSMLDNDSLEESSKL